MFNKYNPSDLSLHSDEGAVVYVERVLPQSLTHYCRYFHEGLLVPFRATVSSSPSDPYGWNWIITYVGVNLLGQTSDSYDRLSKSGKERIHRQIGGAMTFYEEGVVRRLSSRAASGHSAFSLFMEGGSKSGLPFSGLLFKPGVVDIPFCATLVSDSSCKNSLRWVITNFGFSGTEPRTSGSFSESEGRRQMVHLLGIYGEEFVSGANPSPLVCVFEE